MQSHAKKLDKERDKHLGTGSRFTLAVASLALLLLFVTPIWRITLDAPQYPEGLGMIIRIDDVTGEKPNDLKNINGLNHYIGMKEIVPESIPELRWMPWIIGGLCLLGLFAAIHGRRGSLYAWTTLFLIVAVVGLVDFYLWEYDYGHNLDLENAAIKVPGMNYQPPLIGSKKLLNFTAVSMPAIGGWIAFLSLGAGMLLSFLSLRRGKKTRAAARANTGNTARGVAVAFFAAGMFVAGCATGPSEIRYGEDVCVHCRMPIADPRFAAELVTETGKVLKFDAIECAAAHASADLAGTEYEAFVHLPEDLSQWVHAGEARFIRSSEIHSPMGAGIGVLGGAGAHASQAQSPEVRPVDAHLLTWHEIVAAIESGSDSTHADGTH